MNAPQARQNAASAANEASLVQLHMQAHNGLTAALRMLSDTTTSDTDMLRRALGRAMRATTVLKQACALSAQGVTV